MGLAKLQKSLVRLYTDTALRADFQADPDGICETMGLTEIEASQLTSVSLKQIDSFAYSLRRKRSGAVRGLLPRTCRSLGKRFESLFAKYADEYCPRGHHKHQNDAIQFASFISNNARHENIMTSVVEIAQFESAFLQSNQSGSFFCMRLFKHDVKQMVHEIDDNSQVIERQFRLSFGIWIRMSSFHRFYYFRFPKLTA